MTTPRRNARHAEEQVMATNLVALITQFLTPDVIARIASALALDRNVVDKAIGASIPTLLASLAGTAAKPDGARLLSDAMSQSQTFSADSLVKSLQGGGLSNVAQGGSNALASALGGNTLSGLAGAIAKFAGIDERSGKSLLGILGPVVLGTLNQEKRNLGLDSTGIAGLLASQQDQIAAKIPSGFLNQLSGAGLLNAISGGARSGVSAAASAAESVARGTERTVAGASEAARAARAGASSQLPYWLLAIAVLGGLVWYLLPGSGGVKVDPTPTASIQQPRMAATTGSVNFTVAGTDLSSQVNSSIGALRTALTGITDVASAEAALPRIKAATSDLDKVSSLAAQLSPESRKALASMIAAATPTIEQLCSKVLTMPQVGTVARPAIDELRKRLDLLSRA
jgi:hypothetical protein